MNPEALRLPMTGKNDIQTNFQSATRECYGACIIPNLRMILLEGFVGKILGEVLMMFTGGEKQQSKSSFRVSGTLIRREVAPVAISELAIYWRFTNEFVSHVCFLF
jgi:hypothetical protein